MSHCIVPGCTSGRFSDRKKRKIAGQKNLTFFSVPKDPELLAKWKKEIPTADFTADSRICELHFFEEDIQRYYITKMPDGSVNKIQRGKVTLTKGSVPHNCDIPMCSSIEATNRKVHVIVIDNPDDDRNENPMFNDECIEAMDILDLENEIIMEEKYQITVGSIKVPNQWWGISSTPKYIVCAKWNDTFFPKLRVIIDNDLKVKV